ncbi:MAG TPA: LON peptidase substrate-binding domain-containing protein [Steroidobacter sp.]|nr:LON peptidase substrate-binding domain-containing protein [Steroidobacter sp.]HWK75358.1 LON peptidase substrate-binding domain-containing protein [Povalibacter sp.]
MSSTLPLFPLNAVLFPGGPLKLRIFEPRYVDMIGRCMRESAPFGVAMIVEGVEAGGTARTVSIGTSARIVDFEQLSDGLLGITAVGERCFRIESVSQQPDGLNVAEVEWLAAEPAVPVPTVNDYLVQLLQHALPHLAPAYDFTPVLYEDAAWVGARLVEILPLPLTEKQLCLEIRDPLQRLDHLRSRVKVESVLSEDDEDDAEEE